MSDEDSFYNILIAEMATELSCTQPDCTNGEGGSPYKTPALEFDQALQLLDRHLLSHGVQCGRGGGAGGGVKTQLAKIPRPEISGGSSQEDFRQFKCQWNQYVCDRCWESR